MDLPQWPRPEYEALPRILLSRGSRLKPAVWRVETDDGPLVVKDAAAVPAWSRALALFLLARERRVLQRLQGVEGVPQLRARVGASAFAATLLPGQALDRQTFASAPRLLADGLLRLLARLHARHVYHLDLRQRQNVLVDEHGGVAVVDFGAAWCLGPLTRPLLQRLLGWVDRQAALKYLARYAPQELSRAEALEVLRAERWRRWWPFTPHRSRGALEGARERLRQEGSPKG